MTADQCTGAETVFRDREDFITLKEAKILIEQWRKEYNKVVPHSSLRYQPPGFEAIVTLVTRQQVVSFSDDRT